MISANQTAKETNVNSSVINLAYFIPLFREIGNLKRIRGANSGDSFAANLFRRAWCGINAGSEARIIVVKVAADAVIGANLGACDSRAERAPISLAARRFDRNFLRD